MCKYRYIHIYMYTDTKTICMDVYIHIYTYLFTYVFIYLFTCIYLYVHIYVIHTQVDSLKAPRTLGGKFRAASSSPVCVGTLLQGCRAHGWVGTHPDPCGLLGYWGSSGALLGFMGSPNAPLHATPLNCPS